MYLGSVRKPIKKLLLYCKENELKERPGDEEHEADYMRERERERERDW